MAIYVDDKDSLARAITELRFGDLMGVAEDLLLNAPQYDLATQEGWANLLFEWAGGQVEAAEEALAEKLSTM